MRKPSIIVGGQTKKELVAKQRELVATLKGDIKLYELLQKDTIRKITNARADLYREQSILDAMVPSQASTRPRTKKAKPDG